MDTLVINKKTRFSSLRSKECDKIIITGYGYRNVSLDNVTGNNLLCDCEYAELKAKECNLAEVHINNSSLVYSEVVGCKIGKLNILAHKVQYICQVKFINNDIDEMLINTSNHAKFFSGCNIKKLILENGEFMFWQLQRCRIDTLELKDIKKLKNFILIDVAIGKLVINGEEISLNITINSRSILNVVKKSIMLTTVD